ncbi:MAG: hypothetical protein IH608_12560 [Proteobacteria bacterium]|nr:hypothetical protein [Pseudomonadota bacterium]
MRRPEWAAAMFLALVLSGRGVGAQVLDSIVARVDERVVTWSEVLQEREIRRVEGEPESLRDPETVLAGLLRRYLLRAEAEKLRLPEQPGAPDQDVEALGEDAWADLARIGLDRADLEERARERRLVDQYLALRREMTFVPESEIRTFYGQQTDVFGQKSLAEVRDEVRAYLADQAFRRELEQWIERQMSEGRVSINPLPGQ